MKKIKFNWFLLGLAAPIISIPILVASCSNGNNFDFSEENRPTNVNYISNISAVGDFETKVLQTYDRQVQKDYYDSEVWRLYHDSYGFIYPGQNYNYEYGNNRYFTNKDGHTIDAMELVFNERINGDTYNYPVWIQNEINAGTFKKHRAADNFYINNMDNIQAVEQYFSIPTNNLGRFNLGLYAPAGEVVTITFDDETWELMKRINYQQSFNITINANYWDNKDKNDSGRISNRYPFVKSDFTVDINDQNKSIKFGSPFGGNISIYINSPLIVSAMDHFNKKANNMKFTIKGAIPCVLYNDGYTTKEDWSHQMELIKNELLAPVIQCNTPYFSYNLPFSGKNEIHGLYVPNLEYPNIITQKWNDFLFLSNYLAGNDLKQYYKKIDMQFCDDIWGGAGAWGGGWTFWCPTDWGKSFLLNNTIQVFNSYSSWGNFHEINHNFQQDAALFKIHSHGETNQVTSFDLSVISDIGRFRNELNWTGEMTTNNCEGWTQLDNAFTNIATSRDAGFNNSGEYHLYSLLNFTMGPKKYSDYVRNDIIEHPNTTANWTGAEEIARLSDYLKINLWPAFQNYSRYWKDWPETYEKATSNEKKWIDSISTRFPTMDFVGNLYAAGSYLYDVDTNSYKYTGDTNTPFEIPAYEPYVFEFDNMCNSMNKNFNWVSLKFDNKTKNNATLSLDPNNNKRLIYTPNKNSKATDIDEFDVSLVPGDWEGKPKNYVPEYKFKIKVRQVFNSAIYETYYNVLPYSNLEDNFKYLMDTEADKKMSLSNFKTIFFPDTKLRGSKIRFKFIVPETNTYDFNMFVDDYAKIIVNDTIVNDYPYSPNINLGKYKLTKGQVLDFQIYLINNGGPGGFNMWYYKDGKEFNITDNIVNPDVDINPNEILNDPKYQYKSRTIDNKTYVDNLSTIYNFSNYEYIKNCIDINKYKLTSKYDNVVKLNDYGLNYFEHWNEHHGPGQAASSFTVTFDNPQNVQTFFFGHRTNNHSNARPTGVKISGVNSLGESIILYDGPYGKQYNDRNLPYSILTLDKPELVKSLYIEIYNENYNGIILQWFRMFDSHYDPIDGPAFTFNRPEINFTKNWIFKRNDEEINSAMNGIYLCTDKANSAISFNLNKTKGFVLIGTKHPNGGYFEIKVNDKTYSLNNYSNHIENNSVLFEIEFDEFKDINVMIINKSNAELALSYFLSFGKSSYLS